MDASHDAVYKGTDTDSGKGGSIESVVTAIDNDPPLNSNPHDITDLTADTTKDCSVGDGFDDTDTASLEYDDECSTFSETTSIASHQSAVAIATKTNDILSISSANVTGFRPVKPHGSLVADEKPEYVFIVEVEWSDGRHNVVKRTYADFCSFHCYLLDEFSRLAESATSGEGMRMNLYLPSK